MALGDPIGDVPIVKATIIYGNGKVGWSETYHIACTGTLNPLTAASNTMGRVIRLRNPVLPLDTVAEAMRCSYVTKNGKSSLEEVPDFGLGAGTAAIESANPKLGWGVIVSNDDQWVEDTRVYRSWPPALIPYSGGAGALANPPVLVKTWAQAMENLLKNPYSTNGGTTRFCLRSFVKPGTDVNYPQFPVNVVDLSVDGRILITAKSADVGPNLKKGKTLMLHVNRKKCVKGFSGRWKIVSAIVNAPDVVILLDQKPCCARTSDLEGLEGVAQVYKTAFYAVQFFTLGRQITKKTGRAFFVSAGKQSGKCC